MAPTSKAAEVAKSLQQALDLLQAHPIQPRTAQLPEPLQSLLEQCQALVQAAADPQPVRTVHHLACTGGTLISKCLAVMPNVTLLSEIDPLSRMISAKRHLFWPTDILYSGRVALRPISDEIAVKSFNAGLAELHKGLTAEGRFLVIRDHAHSQFCTDENPESRPGLREILLRVLPVLSVLTVRHPLDSFLSLKKNGWDGSLSSSLETYAQRYKLFLVQCADFPLFYYEDFVADPDTVMAQMCTALDLPFQPGAEALLKVVKLTGDSGRSSTGIAARPRRSVPDDVAKQAKSSPAYHRLCETLGYPADHG
jgi:hypothetical protein